MALAHIGLALGVGLGIVGTATATDLISLREVAAAVDLPLVSAAVFGLRQAMGTDTAHSLEAVSGVAGGLALLVPLRGRLRGLELPKPRLAALSPLVALLR